MALSIVPPHHALSQSLPMLTTEAFDPGRKGCSSSGANMSCISKPQSAMTLSPGCSNPIIPLLSVIRWSETRTPHNSETNVTAPHYPRFSSQPYPPGYGRSHLCWCLPHSIGMHAQITTRGCSTTPTGYSSKPATWSSHVGSVVVALTLFICFHLAILLYGFMLR